MILDSNDEGWFSDGDEDAAAPDIHPGDYSFPLALGKTLTGACCSAMMYTFKAQPLQRTASASTLNVIIQCLTA